MTSLAFLHTADVHIATFDALRDELAPGLALRHVVEPALLAQAREHGVEDPTVVQGVEAAMRRAAEGGAAVVVCTCSTIGAVAEAMDTGGRFLAQRIDRAMADEAVRRGPRVAIIAALDSTLVPTQSLLLDSARRQKRAVAPALYLIDDAWPHFERGDMPSYHVAIADGIADVVATGEVDVVLLAQASMAGAVPLFRDRQTLGAPWVPVFSSPRPGFAAALMAMRAAEAAQ